MKQLFINSIAVAAFALAGQAGAAVVTVTPDDINTGGLNTWNTANYRGVANGYTSFTTSGILDERPRSGDGSMHMALTNGSGKVDLAYNWGFVAGRTLGKLDTLSYDWLRVGGGTAAAHLQPALRLNYDADGNVDTTGDRGYLIWEQIYNGGGLVEDNWTSSNILAGNFWMRQFTPGNTVENYDTTLAEWIGGAHPSAVADLLGANTAILGLEFGIGSGWNGSFTGYIDNVTYGFRGDDATTFNFETRASDVPEPASFALLGLGIVAFAAARKRKQA